MNVVVLGESSLRGLAVPSGDCSPETLARPVPILPKGTNHGSVHAAPNHPISTGTDLRQTRLRERGKTDGNRPGRGAAAQSRMYAKRCDCTKNFLEAKE